MEEIEYLGETIRRWKVGASTFLAWPERGARLMNWNISYADGGFRDVIAWPELDGPEKAATCDGGNPILFPFSARTFHEGKIYFWKDPAGTVRPMPMHGIARQGLFEITRIDATGFAARLSPDLAARQAYPYEYDFEVIYRFQEKRIDVELRLSNRDSQPIPWCAGHHFYFALPWIEGTTRKDYSILVPAKKAVRHSPDGALVPVTGYKKRNVTMDTKSIVDQIHYDLTQADVICSCAKDDSKIKVTFSSEGAPRDGNTLVTWTRSDESQFYCIEPWMGPPNSPEHGIGLRTVGPGETDAYSISVEI